MAVRETLEFDLRNALRQVSQLEEMIEDLGRPVVLDVDIRGDATREIQSIDDRMDEIIVSAQALSRELGQTETAADAAATDFARMSTELGTAEHRASDLARELLEGDRAAGRLDTEVGEVSTALDRSERQAAGLTRELKQADRAAASINTTATGLENKLKGVFAGVAAGAGLALGLRGANAAIQSFAQLEDSINAVNVVFGVGAEKVLEFGENAARSAGLSEAAFNQAVVPIGSLLQNFGFDADAASEAAVILVQRAADLASVMGGTVQEALLAVGAALRGEADPLERYGASVSAARVEQFALANELARTKAEITPAITLQARYGLILADTAKVQGDFANTAGDLANLQRAAAAEAANFGTEVGEVLAPAMEGLVALLPDLLEGLRQMVPGFANAADSAAAFFDSIEQGSGIRAPFQAVAAGIGLVSDAFGGLTDLGQGVFSALTLDFSGVGQQMDQFADRFARATKRISGQNLARELDKGTDASVAFVNAIADFAGKEENLRVFADAYQTFAIQANLSDEALRDATIFMIENAEQARLSAGEIEFLNQQLTQLNGLLAVDTRRRGPFQGLEEVPFETITTRFTTMTSALEEIPAQIDTVAVRTRAASDALSQSLNPFDEPPEAIALSAREFFDRVTAEINREAEFQAGIVELILRKQFNLARILGEQGPAAQPALTSFLKNLDVAAATEAALATGKTEASEAIGDFLEQAIAAAEPGPARQALIDFMTDGIIDSPEVEAAIVTGTASAANTTTSSYRDALEEEFEQIDASRIQQKLAHLFDDVTFVISADQFQFPTSLQGVIDVGSFLAGGGLTQGIVNVVNNIYNPTTTDLPTNVAQANQSTAAVSTLFTRVQS